MLLSNKSLQKALALTLSQQIALALSTWYIAQAGSALITQNSNLVLTRVAYFFFFALSAYALSSVQQLFANRAKNELWQTYVRATFEEMGTDQSLATPENRENTLAWLSGEAESTLNEVSSFLIQATSLYFNIILTILVFGLTLGSGMTTVISLAMLLSIAIVSTQRKKIERWSSQLQSRKLEAILGVRTLWDIHFHANTSMNENARTLQTEKMRRYFDHTEKI
jgi:hypothetical protein